MSSIMPHAAVAQLTIDSFTRCVEFIREPVVPEYYAWQQAGPGSRQTSGRVRE